MQKQTMIERLLQQLRASVTPFRILYYGVATYTLRHSALGFATIEPDASMAWAYLAAAVVDVGMLLAAEALRDKVTAWMVAGLLTSCLLSAFSQLLFAATNAGPLLIAPGAEWMRPFATWLIQLRVVVLPLAMPLLVIVYAFASKMPQSEAQPVPSAGSNGKPRATYHEQVLALLRQNPRLSAEALQNAVGCKDARTVRRAIAAWEADGA